MSDKSSALLRTTGSIIIALSLGFGFGWIGGTHRSALQWSPYPTGEAYAEEMDQQQSSQQGR